MSAELQLSKPASAKMGRANLRNRDPAVSRSAIRQVRRKNKQNKYFKNVIWVFFSVLVAYCPSGKMGFGVKVTQKPAAKKISKNIEHLVT